MEYGKTSEYNAAQDKIHYKSQYTENPSEFTRSINKYDLANELKDFSKIGLNNIPNFEPKKEEDLMQILDKIEPLEIYV